MSPPDISLPIKYQELADSHNADSPGKGSLPISRRRFLSFLGFSTAGATALALRNPLGGAEQPDPAAVGNAERVFHESTEIFSNPERGFYAQRSSDRMDRLGTL